MHVAQRFELFLDTYRRLDGTPWTGQKLDEASDGVVARAYVTNLRKVRIENPGYEKMLAIAKAMGFPPALWFEETPGDGIQAVPAEGQDLAGVEASLTSIGTFSAYNRSATGTIKKEAFVVQGATVQHVNVFLVSQGEALLQRARGPVQGDQHRTRRGCCAGYRAEDGAEGRAGDQDQRTLDRWLRQGSDRQGTRPQGFVRPSSPRSQVRC